MPRDGRVLRGTSQPVTSAPQAFLHTISGRPRVWRIRIGESLRACDEPVSDLDEAERRRAQTFRRERDRLRFVVARSSLRRLLARELGLETGQIEFGQNAFGKPSLLNGGARLHFNTSHSGDWILHALDTVGPVGVDVELVQASFANIADFGSALSPEERAQIADLPPAHRARALARAWVRKEAYVKAIGQGISCSLTDISIGSDAAGNACLLYDRNPECSPFHWQFEDIEIDANHVACVVYAGPQANARPVFSV